VGGDEVDDSDELHTEFSGSIKSSAKKGAAPGERSLKSDGLLSNANISKEDITYEKGGDIVPTPAAESQMGAASIKAEEEKTQVSEVFEVLGMISLNKELFLFEKPVPMVDGVENWLVNVEKQMHDTISKMLSYAVSSFPNQPLDEWILDYPQQIIITVLHLILSHEISEVLE
jgi:hypothetical protein